MEPEERSVRHGFKVKQSNERRMRKPDFRRIFSVACRDDYFFLV